MHYIVVVFDILKRKLKLRAADLAREMTNEFLVEERQTGFIHFGTVGKLYLGEWTAISKIAKPEKYGEHGLYYYTLLYKWTNNHKDAKEKVFQNF